MAKRKLTWLFWKPSKREGEALYTYKGGSLSWVWFLYKGRLGKPFHYVIQCSSSEYYARSEKHTPWDIRPTSCRQKWQTGHECNSKSCCLDNPNKSPNIEVNLPSPALIQPSHGDLMRSLPCRHGERHTSHGILAHISFGAIPTARWLTRSEKVETALRIGPSALRVGRRERTRERERDGMLRRVRGMKKGDLWGEKERDCG